MVLSYGMGASWVRKRRPSLAMLVVPVRLLDNLEVVLNIVERGREKRGTSSHQSLKFCLIDSRS